MQAIQKKLLGSYSLFKMQLPEAYQKTIWTHYTNSQIPALAAGMSEDWFQNTAAHL